MHMRDPWTDMNSLLSSPCVLSRKKKLQIMSETFLFTSESVNEGHPGKYMLSYAYIEAFVDAKFFDGTDL